MTTEDSMDARRVATTRAIDPCLQARLRNAANSDEDPGGAAAYD